MSFNKSEAVRNAEKFLAAGKIKQAVTEYQQIVKRDPDDITNVNVLGDLLVKCGETTDALQNFCKVAEHYSQKGFPQKAIAVYNKILRLKPDCIDTLAKLAEMNRQKGATAEARVQYTKLAEFYEQKGEAKKLLLSLRALAAIDKQGSKHLMKIGEVCRSGAMTRDAAEAFAEAGERYLAQEQIDAALDAFSKALEQDAENVRAFQGYVRISLIRGTAGNAIEKLEDILNEQPENSELRELLGECYMETGEQAKAEEILMTLVAQNPERYKLLIGPLEKHLADQDAKAAMRIISITSDRLLSDEKPEDLLKWTNAILEIDPYNIEAMRLQARFYTSRGDVLSATTILERIAVLASRSVEASAPSFNGQSTYGGGVNSVEPYGLSDENETDSDVYSSPSSLSETGIARFEVEEEVEPAREYIPSQEQKDSTEDAPTEPASSFSFDDSRESAREYTIEDAAAKQEAEDSDIREKQSGDLHDDPDAGKDMGLAVSAEDDAEVISQDADEPAAELKMESAKASEAVESYGFEILAITETRLAETSRRNADSQDSADEDRVVASADAAAEYLSDESGLDATEESVGEGEALNLEETFTEGFEYPTLDDLAAVGFGDDEVEEESAPTESFDDVVDGGHEASDSAEFDVEASDEASVTEPEFDSESVAEPSADIVFDANQAIDLEGEQEFGRADVFLSTADELAGLGGEVVETVSPVQESFEVSDDVPEYAQFEDNSAEPAPQGIEDEPSSEAPYGESVAGEIETFGEAGAEAEAESYEYSFDESIETFAAEATDHTVTEPAAFDVATSDEISDHTIAESTSFAAEAVEEVADDARIESPSYDIDAEYAEISSYDASSDEDSIVDEVPVDESVASFDAEIRAEYEFSPVTVADEVSTDADGAGDPAPIEADETFEARSEADEIEAPVYGEMSAPYETEVSSSGDSDFALSSSDLEAEQVPSADIQEPEPVIEGEGSSFDVNAETVHYVAFEYSDFYSNGNGNGNGNGDKSVSEEAPAFEELSAATSHSDEPQQEDATFSEALDTRISELVAQMNFEFSTNSDEMPVEEAVEPAAASADEAPIDSVVEPTDRGPAVFIPAEDYDPRDLQGFILRTDFRGRLFLTEFSFDSFEIPAFVVELPEEADAWFDLSDSEIDEAVYPHFTEVNLVMAPIDVVQDFVIVPDGEIPVEAVAAASAEAIAPTPLEKVQEDREKKLRHLLEGVDFFLSEGFFEVAQQSLQSIVDEYGNRPEFAPYHERVDLFISHAEPERPITPASNYTNASLLSSSPKPYDPDFPELEALGKTTPDDIRKRDEVVEIDENIVFDYETCYDTATAYREMGLLDYAVKEFENALKLVKAGDGSRRFFQCCTMLGHCFMDYGKPDLAVTWFRRAQETPGLTEEEDLAVLYEIANALESHGKTVEAAKLFGHINASSVEYRDASQRFYRLRNGR